MSRMKTFRKYLIWFLLFYAFVSLMSYGFIRTTYVTMDSYNIDFDSPKVTIDDAKVTKVNGYIHGRVTNNTDTDLGNKYIKVDLISKTGNVITSRYIDISNLKKDEEREIKARFNAENIKEFNMTLVDKEELKKFDIITTKVINIACAIFIVGMLLLPKK